MVTIDSRIGARIEVEGCKGTILFEGPVEGTKGVWLGIDWDDVTRGKHDGSHNGVVYFIASGITSASFVRESKVNFGKSFIKAVRERYTTRLLPEVAKEMYVKGLADQITAVELVGNEEITARQSQIDKLEEVHVSDMRVCGLVAPDEENEAVDYDEAVTDSAFPVNAVTLGLDNNLISSWTTVADITSKMPRLKTLHLDGNRLELPKGAHELSGCFMSLKVLTLNRLNLTWSSLSACFPMWPSLEELILTDNLVSYIEPGLELLLPNLLHINLEGNPISDWNAFWNLGSLPRLHSVGLANCHLPDINDYQALVSTMFPQLAHLSVQNNKISRWTTISQLNKMNNLSDFICTKNPVLEKENFDTNRQLVLARLTKLTRLNQIYVDQKERRGAEIDYFKKYAGDYLKLSTPESQAIFKLEHPTYDHLIDSFGQPDQSELANPKSSTLKTSLLNIELALEKPKDGPASIKSHGPFKKKVPPTMSVQKVKAMAARLFKGVNVRDYDVKIVSGSDDMRTVNVDNEMKELSYYGLTDGDLVVLSPRMQ